MKRKIMARLHTRITPEQKKFLEKTAKKTNRTEGATLRIMIDYFIKNNAK